VHELLWTSFHFVYHSLVSQAFWSSHLGLLNPQVFGVLPPLSVSFCWLRSLKAFFEGIHALAFSFPIALFFHYPSQL